MTGDERPGELVDSANDSDIPAGWYPDPDGKPADRYWDGTAWSSQTRPQTPVVAPPPAPAPSSTPRQFVVPVTETVRPPFVPATSEPRSYNGLIVAMILLLVVIVSVSAIVIRRHQVDEDARRAGDIGANIGGPANSLKTMYDVLCPDGPLTTPVQGVNCTNPVLQR